MPEISAVERNVLPARGPRFFIEGGEVLFQFVVDTSNVIGPRPASRKDQAEHAGAWAQFCAAEGVSPLDRDGSGDEGGSLPTESPQAAPVGKPRRARRQRG